MKHLIIIIGLIFLSLSIFVCEGTEEQDKKINIDNESIESESAEEIVSSITENEQEEEKPLESNNKKLLKEILIKYQNNDINLADIDNLDIYTEFRNSKYYKTLLKMLPKLNDGIVLDNRDDFIKEINAEDLFYPDTDPSPGGITFESDGEFKIFPSETCGMSFYDGDWRIEGDKMVLILYGFAGFKNALAAGRDEKELDEFQEHEDENLLWMEKYDEPIIEKIKLKDIKLKLVYDKQYDDRVVEYIIMGDVENQKIIAAKTIKFYNIDDY